jgi:hypothetical protein
MAGEDVTTLPPRPAGKRSQWEMKELAWDRKEWRAAAYQSQDCNTIIIRKIQGRGANGK